jgi:hypothetical protein
VPADRLGPGDAGAVINTAAIGTAPVKSSFTRPARAAALVVIVTRTSGRRYV